ncbi:MAG: type II restriction endonuclease [Pseudomonadota bacterium]|nr:type II restriction endonuclease [Pseudomonadota bacterium]
MTYKEHISSSDDLVTLYERTRAGFIALALEKNRKATPFIEEAKALKAIASKCVRPADLVDFKEIRRSVLIAAGVSEKASSHLAEEDRTEAIRGLIENFLEPYGKDFVDELVYRFLLIRGDSLGGSMRNLGGVLGERKLTRAILSTLKIEGRDYRWFHSKSRAWIQANKDDADIELHIRGLHWEHNGNPRTLIYNLAVPVVEKNVDLCLFNASPRCFNKSRQSCHHKPDLYLALGELKGGIDPAGADEHWKTANSALNRIRSAFSGKGLYPHTFFIGAAIEKAMAVEIFAQLENGAMTNAANLTNENQLVSICQWLIHI